MNLDQILEAFQTRPRFAPQFTAWRTLPAKPARFADYPRKLDPRLQQALARSGIRQLYTHQAEAFDAVRRGEDIAVVTPTASGKTLCYNLPVLDTILSAGGARALYLFPTKALGADQVDELQTLIGAPGAEIGAFTYDGDPPGDARRTIRAAGHIVVTNPDMLHTAILPHHTKWLRLFENLKYIVVDELHHYRGVFGSHLANVLRRLDRVCRFYGSTPQFICCSATIGNPREHAERLVGRPVTVLDQSGAPSGERVVALYNPPVVNPALGIRRDAVREAVALTEELLRTPEDFTVHPKLVKQLDRRRESLAEADIHTPTIDWAHAESLAFASLLREGIPIRLTGQDTERGTFSQRHLVLHDPNTGHEHSPIQHLPGALAPMELHNSPLSEIACLGFEYGYSQEGPETLVLWEAQFGDFVNVAQVIVDQFIGSGLAKWGQTSRLTLLLPHGYEGSGPEHSSARLERFLALAAEGNIRVANPTTPAQYFHLLRRQARIAKQRPLVMMTPKSLLRLPQATSAVQELCEERFRPVLPEPGIDPDRVQRLIVCSGKVYYDLIGHEQRASKPELAIGRVELLYPFPQAEILELVESYPRLDQVVWVQEEPRNMGARAHMAPRLMQILPEHLQFGYIGRPERSSPGEGYPVAHALEQNRIVTTALNIREPISQHPQKSPGER